MVCSFTLLYCSLLPITSLPHLSSTLQFSLTKIYSLVTTYTDTDKHGVGCSSIKVTPNTVTSFLFTILNIAIPQHKNPSLLHIQTQINMACGTTQLKLLLIQSHLSVCRGARCYVSPYKAFPGVASVLRPRAEL